MEEEKFLKNKIEQNTQNNSIDASLNNISYPKIPVTDSTDNQLTLCEFLDNLLPNILAYLLYYFIFIVENHFIGQTDDNKLISSIFAAQTYCNLTILALGWGMCQVIHTICSKSFAKNKINLLGIQVNQVRIIVTAYYILISFINYFFAGHILTLCTGNNSQISHDFIKLLTPSLFFNLHYEIYCKYFEVHLVYMPVNISLVITAIVHPINCWFFISYLKMGMLGVAICSTIIEFLRCAFLCIYALWFNPYPDSHIFFDMNVFNNFWKTTIITIKFGLIEFIENIGITILNLLSARLSLIVVGLNRSLANISHISRGTSFGICETNTILVGYYVGKNDPKNVKRVLNMSLLVGLVMIKL